MRTTAQLLGDAAEALVERRLIAAGWTILGRHVRVGRAELDLLALDPGPPARLVVVEVRWRRRPDHGRPEETVDRRKIVRLRAALGRVGASASLPDGTPVPSLPPAIDVVAVEPGPDGDRLRHYRDVRLD
jgi:Holliday junction resolvase-like predicted endonuclease